MNLEIEEPIRSLQTSLGQDIDMIVDRAVSVAAISGNPLIISREQDPVISIEFGF